MHVPLCLPSGIMIVFPQMICRNTSAGRQSFQDGCNIRIHHVRTVPVYGTRHLINAPTALVPFQYKASSKPWGGLFCISAVPGYALRSHSFLGVILQDVAFFCAYADTGPEYIRSRPHPASNTPQMSLKHAKYALIMVIVTSKYTRYGAVWEQNGSKTGQFTPFGALDSKKVRFLCI